VGVARENRGFVNSGRVKYMSDTYSTPAIKAKVNIMKTGKCLK